MNKKNIAHKILGIQPTPDPMPEVTLEDYIANVGGKLDALTDVLKKIRKVEIAGAEVVTIKGKTPVAGEDYPIPADGHTPTEEELLELIKPLIPVVADGHTPTEEELLELIKPLIPVVADGHTPTEEELLELIKPLIPVVADGHTPTEEELLELIKPLISLDTGENVIKKINKANGLIEQSMIKGLEETLEVLRNGLVNLGGYVATPAQFVDDETPTGLIDGVNTVFVLSKTPLTGSLKVYVNGQRVRVTEDYTFSGRIITFLTAPPTGSILLADFRY